jgi:hypothetical protein
MSRRRSYDGAGDEPDLLDLLGDPVIHAVMRRDGITLAELCAVIQRGRQRLRLTDGFEVEPAETSPVAGWPDWRCPTEPCCLNIA